MTMIKNKLLGLLIVVVLFFGLAGLAQAQSKTFYWKRLDVDITVLPNSDIRIVETQEIVFTRGSFHFGYRSIPMDRLEEIADVEVWEGDRRFRPGRGGEYTYETYRDDGDFVIKWYFPYTSNSTHTYTIAYTVKGGLRFYEGGDQLYWKAVFPDRDFPVKASTVTVHLPEGAKPQKVAAYGVPAEWKIVDDRTVVFTASGEISPGRELEVRVQFPHGVVQGQPAAWQVEYDRWAKYNERWRPLVNLGFGALGLLILVGGPLGLFLLWYTKGRDVPVGLVADYLAEPPSDLPPGVVGTLLDEEADMQDIIATIVDLARRGAIKMVETKERGFLGIGERRNYTFQLLDPDKAERPYEKTLIEELFHGRSEVRLSELREKFYSAIPTLREELYEEVVREGFFRASPERTRKVYMILGIVGLVLSGLLGFFGLVALSRYSGAVVCPPIGLGITAIALIIFGRFMPRKTREGSTAAAKWRAFKRYLANIEKYTDLKEAKDIFDKYLPYAIAFGLERSWIRKFASVGAPAPTWYYPYPPIIVAGRGRRAGMGVPTAGQAEGRGAPSLEGMAEGAFGSLESMSAGLFSMLESASSVLA
ncbi:MAG TPA: DUF2207 domain-containing protein, partial [Anaerolineae bacterium]|nr:DUF2207 domain-containing protein [Anaerolineae bacterium]